MQIQLIHYTINHQVLNTSSLPVSYLVQALSLFLWSLCVDPCQCEYLFKPLLTMHGTLYILMVADIIDVSITCENHSCIFDIKFCVAHSSTPSSHYIWRRLLVLTLIWTVLASLLAMSLQHNASSHYTTTPQPTTLRGAKPLFLPWRRLWCLTGTCLLFLVKALLSPCLQPLCIICFPFSITRPCCTFPFLVLWLQWAVAASLPHILLHVFPGQQYMDSPCHQSPQSNGKGPPHAGFLTLGHLL